MVFAELRDPTRPQDTTEISVGALEVNSILISSERRVAVINEKVLKEGDEIAGFKVIRIEQNAVHLDGPNGKLTLLLSGPVKRLVGSP